MNDFPMTTHVTSSRNSPFEAVANACVLIAKLSSTLYYLIKTGHSCSPAVHSFTETTYFLLIYLVHFLIVQQTNNNILPLQRLVISTFTLLH